MASEYCEKDWRDLAAMRFMDSFIRLSNPSDWKDGQWPEATARNAFILAEAFMRMKRQQTTRDGRFLYDEPPAEALPNDST